MKCRPPTEATPRRRRRAPAALALLAALTLHVAATPQPADTIARGGTHHYATRALERVPLPISAPDEGRLYDVPRSGLQIRVRLFIDARGSVSHVEALRAGPLDDQAVERIDATFRETAFMPGRHSGRDVPSYIDIDVELDGSAARR